MRGQSTYIAYLLDAESMLYMVEERLKDATEKAIKSGDEKQADMIAQLQDALTSANLDLFRILLSINNPELMKHLEIRKTPVGYAFVEKQEEGNNEETVKIAKRAAEIIND